MFCFEVNFSTPGRYMKSPQPNHVERGSRSLRASVNPPLQWQASWRRYEPDSLNTFVRVRPCLLPIDGLRANRRPTSGEFNRPIAELRERRTGALCKSSSDWKSERSNISLERLPAGPNRGEVMNPH